MVNKIDIREDILAKSGECVELLANKNKEVEEVQTKLIDINVNNDVITNSIKSCETDIASEDELEAVISSTNIVDK